jgi:hypothetical protein
MEKVVGFLRQFPHFSEVVVRCARKRDSSSWPYLFSFTGSPKALFEEVKALGWLLAHFVTPQALASKRVNTAASYLIVLHHLEGHLMSRRGAHKLLGLALDLDDLEVCYLS